MAQRESQQRSNQYRSSRVTAHAKLERHHHRPVSLSHFCCLYITLPVPCCASRSSVPISPSILSITAARVPLGLCSASRLSYLPVSRPLPFFVHHPRNVILSSESGRLNSDTSTQGLRATPLPSRRCLFLTPKRQYPRLCGPTKANVHVETVSSHLFYAAL